MIRAKVLHLLRYTGVNLASTVVDYSIFLTLVHFFGMPTVEAAISYPFALVVNYTLTKNYVFGHLTHKSEHRLFMEFVATGMLGLVITAAVIWFTIHYMSVTPVAAKTIAILICFVVLYFVRSRLVFNAQPSNSAVA